MDETTKYFFLHIPKTGGTSVRKMMMSNYASICQVANIKQLKSQYDPNKRLYIGHFNFGVHEKINVKNFKYLTFLRDPIDRAISHYNYVKNRPNDPFYENSNKYDLISYICKIREVQDNQSLKIYGKFNQRNVSIDGINEIIEKHFAFVGITELMDVCLKRMSSVLNLELSNVGHENRNTTNTEVERGYLSRDTLEIIADLNKLDIELYEQRRRIFEPNYQYTIHANQ